MNVNASNLSAHAWMAYSFTTCTDSAYYYILFVAISTPLFWRALKNCGTLLKSLVSLGTLVSYTDK